MFHRTAAAAGCATDMLQIISLMQKSSYIQEYKGTNIFHLEFYSFRRFWTPLDSSKALGVLSAPIPNLSKAHRDSKKSQKSEPKKRFLRSIRAGSGVRECSHSTVQKRTHNRTLITGELRILEISLMFGLPGLERDRLLC